MTEGHNTMRLFKFWIWLLSPPKFYGGGGGGSQTPQTNPEEQALAQISQEKWDEYKSRYVPLENEWIAQTNNLNNPTYHNQASSLASNEVKAKYGPQTQNMGLSMAAGHRVGSGDYLNAANDASQAINRASLGVTDRYLQGKQNVIAMGQGQSTGAMQGLGDVAASSVNNQMNTNTNKFNAKQGQMTGYGLAAGGAIAAASNYPDRTKA